MRGGTGRGGCPIWTHLSLLIPTQPCPVAPVLFAPCSSISIPVVLFCPTRLLHHSPHSSPSFPCEARPFYKPTSFLTWLDLLSGLITLPASPASFRLALPLPPGLPSSPHSPAHAHPVPASDQAHLGPRLALPLPSWPHLLSYLARPHPRPCSAGSPAEAEAEAAQVRSQGMQWMVGASTGLKIDIELGEFQLYIADVMQEEHQDAYIVVPGEGSGEGGRGEVTMGTPHPARKPPR